MKFYLILLSLFSISLGSYAQSENDNNLLRNVIDKPYEFSSYAKDESIKNTDRLDRLESDIDKLKLLAEKYSQEPRLYFLISKLYSQRDTLLSETIIRDNNNEWFSMPVVQENLQGIRDNCTKAIQLQEQSAGKNLEFPMFGTCAGPLMPRQLYERAQKAYLNTLPNVIECPESDDPYNNCVTQEKKNIELEIYQNILGEYISYGFFDDAERVIKELAQLSDEGKTIAEENAPLLAEARQNYDSEKYKEDLALMLPGGTPKPLTIRAADAIAENQKAAIEKERLAKLATSSSASSEAHSSVSSEPSIEPVPIAENNNRLILIGAGVLLLVLIGFVAYRRRK
jgi:hypothetical protein